MEFIQLEDN